MDDAIDKIKTGTIKVVGSVGDVMGAAGDITSSTANAASQLVATTGTTAVNITSNTGQVLTAATSTVAKTLQTVENLSARLENYTKEAQKQAQIEPARTRRLEESELDSEVKELLLLTPQR